MHRHATLTLGALGVAAALGACRSNRQEHSPAAQLHSLSAPVMHHHETYGIAVRDAVVRGDLDAVHRNANELRFVTIEGSPEVADYTHTMQAAASDAARAPDLVSAAHATGSLVQTCADCHARMTGPTRLTVEPPPLPAKDARTRMRRHGWAMNELWDGLIGNSEDPWHAGADVLADPALASSELLPAVTSTPEVDRLAASLQSLGARAQATSDTGVRSVLYGDLLATCAACHAYTR